MLTRSELLALVDLLNRCPLTLSEQLWLTALIARLSAQLPEDADSAQKQSPPD